LGEDGRVKRKRVSAEDVAREAGVSRTTVSFVLNNTPGKNISENTRQRVLQAASRLGYMPNEDARRLAMFRSRAIGLFICHSQYVYTDAFIIRTVEGMAQAVNRYRLQLVIQPLHLQEGSYLSLARKDRVDGLVLINAHNEDPALSEIVEEGFPVVAMDFLEDWDMDQVYVDNRSAAGELTDYLINLGHRKVAMITHASTVYSASELRLQGYRDALARHTIEFREEYVAYGDFSEHSGFVSMQKFISLPDPPSAVFAGNDVVAYGALRAIRDAGLSVPEDISLVGFDDDYLSRYLNPPLTTMALPAAGMGSAAVSLLIGRMDNGGPREPKRLVLPARISIRNSCRRVSEEN